MGSYWSAQVTKGAGNFRPIGMVAAAAANPRRAKLHDVVMGCKDAPADATFIYQLIRTADYTGGGATTANVVPVADDPADAQLGAGAMLVRDTPTVANPTFSGVAMKSFPLYQRASMRWVAAPGRELIVPAATEDAIVLALSANTTVDFSGCLRYEQL